MTTLLLAASIFLNGVNIDGVRAQIAFARGALGARRRRWERWRHGG